MATPGKTAKSGTKRPVKVGDMKAKNDVKGGKGGKHGGAHSKANKFQGGDDRNPRIGNTLL